MAHCDHARSPITSLPIELLEFVAEYLANPDKVNGNNSDLKNLRLTCKTFLGLKTPAKEIFSTVHFYPTQLGLERAFQISEHASYRYYVRNVTFHPPPFDFDATIWERYRAYAKDRSKILDRRKFGDCPPDDGNENESELSRAEVGFAQYLLLYQQQQDLLCKGSYMACCVSALTKFHPLDDVTILGYNCDEDDFAEMYEGTATHIRQCCPAALLGFIAPITVKVAEEHITTSLKAIAIAGTPMFDLEIRGLIEERRPAFRISGLKELSMLPLPLPKRAFEDLSRLDIEFATEESSASLGDETIDWSASLKVLLDSVTNTGILILIIRQPQGFLYGEDPGGYYSMHRLFSHAHYPQLVYLVLDSTEICATDFCAFLGRHQTLTCLKLYDIVMSGDGPGLWRQVYNAIHDLHKLRHVKIVRDVNDSVLLVDIDSFDDDHEHSDSEAKLLGYLLRRGPWDDRIFEPFCI